MAADNDNLSADDSSADEAPSSNDPGNAPEGTPYRALLEEGRSFDVTLREQDGTLTLQAIRPGRDGEGGDEEENNEGETAPREEVTYRFEQMGAGHALLVANGRSVPITLAKAGADTVRVTIGGRTATVQVQDETALLLERFGIAAGAGAAEAEVRAPMPGLVVRVMVEEGQDVEEGDGLLVLEAMKMENELSAPAAGTVTALHAEEGASVGKGDVLVKIE